MKDEDTAVNYRCEIDTAVVTEKQERADPNGTLSLLLLKLQNKHLDTNQRGSTKTVGY